MVLAHWQSGNRDWMYQIRDTSESDIKQWDVNLPITKYDRRCPVLNPEFFLSKCTPSSHPELKA